jgi:hypothetical protein
MQNGQSFGAAPLPKMSSRFAAGRGYPELKAPTRQKLAFSGFNY